MYMNRCNVRIYVYVHVNRCNVRIYVYVHVNKCPDIFAEIVNIYSKYIYIYVQ